MTESSGYTGLDFVGLIFLIIALTSFVWSLRRREFSASDEEASAVLLRGRDARGRTNTSIDMPPPLRRRLMIAGFIVAIVSMALAPVVTVYMAERTKGQIERMERQQPAMTVAPRGASRP